MGEVAMEGGGAAGGIFAATKGLISLPPFYNHLNMPTILTNMQQTPQGVAAIAVLLAIHTAAAFLGSLSGFTPPPPKHRQHAAPQISAGGTNSSGSSSGGGGALPAFAQPSPDRSAVEAIDLGEPISIIATVIDEAEAEDPGAAAGNTQQQQQQQQQQQRSGAGCWPGSKASRSGAARAAAAAALRGGGGVPHLQPVMELVASSANDGSSDQLVGLLALSSALLAMSAVLRAVSLRITDFWWSDHHLLLLQALPELLSAVLLLWPHLMARVGMASRYSRWQPKKGKPATSRPRNSNPAIWKRAGMPAPASRTQTVSDGV